MPRWFEAADGEEILIIDLDEVCVISHVGSSETSMITFRLKSGKQEFCRYTEDRYNWVVDQIGVG